jgi:hypothetical protein
MRCAVCAYSNYEIRFTETGYGLWAYPVFLFTVAGSRITVAGFILALNMNELKRSFFPIKITK